MVKLSATGTLSQSYATEPTAHGRFIIPIQFYSTVADANCATGTNKAEHQYTMSLGHFPLIIATLCANINTPILV
jgi:hypothetical protein